MTVAPLTEWVKVLIGGGHAPTRAGIRQALEGEGFSIVGEAADATSVVELAVSVRPDVCLLDVHMPGSGIHAARQVNERMPDSAVVMLADVADDDELFDAFRAGAAGFLMLDTDPERLPHALRGVLAGEAAVPRMLVSRLIDEFRMQGRRRRLMVDGQRGPELSRREWEVLELFRQGLTTRQTAERLFLSPVTVRRHASTIVRKLRVQDRAAAVRLLEQGAVDAGSS
jgi:DNA-binding NarL/FixJ family response regulator